MPNHEITPDASLRCLAESLMVEYAGALPPGQVLAVVYRANRLTSVGGAPPAPLAARMSTVEAVARRLLTDRLAALSTVPHHADALMASS